jgi:hypothetical protein
MKEDTVTIHASIAKSGPVITPISDRLLFGKQAEKRTTQLTMDAMIPMGLKTDNKVSRAPAMKQRLPNSLG